MKQPKIILGIETSCDETAAAVVEISASGKPSADKGVTILSNVVASSAKLQEKYGGVIPEQAAREQLKSIIPVIQEALIQSNLYSPSSKNHLPSSTIYRPAIDAIAVTYGPGLIGSLLVGVETAKTLALVWDKPLIPVNHLIGHFYANWIEEKYHEVDEYHKYHGGLIPRGTRDTRITRGTPSFPCIGLLVSGGHTDLVLFTDHGKYKYLGGTRDDAAGECFDKCARLLGLPYPGGPAIAKLTKSGDPHAFDLPRPMINSEDFDFSFSGLKTAVANQLSVLSHQLSDKEFAGSRLTGQQTTEKPKSENREPKTENRMLSALASSIEAAIIDVLVEKTIRAAQTFNIDQIMIAGGVAANQKLVSEFKLKIENLKLKIQLSIPPAELCTDNAAMIASAAFFNYRPINPLTLQANPNLNLSG